MARLAKTASVGPSSTIRPAYITQTRSAHARDHPEVVRDQDQRHAAMLTLALEQLEQLRLDRDVERGRRLVGDQQLRVGASAIAIRGALAQPAGELVRVLESRRSGSGTPTSSSSSTAWRCASPLRQFEMPARPP